MDIKDVEIEIFIKALKDQCWFVDTNDEPYGNWGDTSPEEMAECVLVALEQLVAQGPIRLPNGYEVIAPGQLPSWIKRVSLKSTYPGSYVPLVHIYDLPNEDTEDAYERLEDDINEGRVCPVDRCVLYRNTLENK